jgi:predicted nucleic acid-binding protein
MTVVIPDTSPINHLILIGEIDILPLLYTHLVIPADVYTELTDMSAPLSVRRWADQLPAWLEVRQSPNRDASLMDLDAGESAAIALAELEREVLLLIDESAGRLEASRRGIPNTGTLGVLRRAATESLLDLQSALDRFSLHEFPRFEASDNRTACRGRYSQASD